MVIVTTRKGRSSAEPQMRTVVQALMVRVRARVGKDAELAVLMAPLVGKVYSSQIISGWRKGHDRMPAEVLLAACKVTGVRIDEVLFEESEKTIVERLEQELAALRAEFGQLRREVRTRPLLAGDTPPE